MSRTRGDQLEFLAENLLQGKYQVEPETTVLNTRKSHNKGNGKGKLVYWLKRWRMWNGRICGGRPEMTIGISRFWYIKNERFLTCCFGFQVPRVGCGSVRKKEEGWGVWWEQTGWGRKAQSDNLSFQQIWCRWKVQECFQRDRWIKELRKTSAKDKVLELHVEQGVEG